MVQATTPTFVLTLPDTVDLTQAKNVYFSLVQGSTIIKKLIDEPEAHQVSVYLTQAETLGLNGVAQMQLNWTYADGSRACTNIVNVTVDPNLLRAVVE